MSKRALALGLDPGFRNLGVAVQDICTDEVLAMRVLHTKKIVGVAITDDNARRAMECADALDSLFLEFPDIRVVCSESLSYPRNASVIAKQSIQWGIVIAKARQYRCDFLHTLPQELKIEVTGSRKASKEVIIESLSSLFKSQDLSKIYAGVSAGNRNHCFDALGAIVACRGLVEYSLLKAKYT